MLAIKSKKSYEWREIDSDKRLEFLTFYANQKKLFPDILDIDEFYEKFNANRKKSQSEVYNFHQLIKTDEIILKGIEKIDLKRPNFFYSFRYGSMMLIPLILIKYGVPLNFIAGASSMKKKEKFMNASYEAGLGFAEDDIIIGDSLSGAYKIFKNKKLGKSFFCSTDIGVGMESGGKANVVQVNINNSILNSRIGPAFLAHRMNIPFIGVWSTRINNKIYIDFDSPIHVKDPVNQTKKIWEEKFNPILNRDPSQWESLHYVNKHMVSFVSDKMKTDKSVKSSFKFNKMNYDFILRKNMHYLFDTNTTDTLKIDFRTFELLKAMKEEERRIDFFECESIFSPRLMQQLIKFAILI